MNKDSSSIKNIKYQEKGTNNSEQTVIVENLKEDKENSLQKLINLNYMHNKPTQKHINDPNQQQDRLDVSAASLDQPEDFSAHNSYSSYQNNNDVYHGNTQFINHSNPQYPNYSNQCHYPPNQRMQYHGNEGYFPPSS